MFCFHRHAPWVLGAHEHTRMNVSRDVTSFLSPELAKVSPYSPPPLPQEERRVIYVGKIRPDTTRTELRDRFEVFGEIEECTVNLRDDG